jgi:hypothetical protein
MALGQIQSGTAAPRETVLETMANQNKVVASESWRLTTRTSTVDSE